MSTTYTSLTDDIGEEYRIWTEEDDTGDVIAVSDTLLDEWTEYTYEFPT